MEQAIEHTEQGDNGAFVIMQDGRQIAEMTYHRASPAVATIDHTHVDPSLRGQGVARRLLDAAVAWARQNNVKLRSTCSYASAVFVKDKSLRDVLA